jgi:5'-3' exonuclease
MTYRMLLDTSSLMYRAFFSVPPAVTDRRGQPINAVYGYLEMTARLFSTYRPGEIVHVYDDDWKPAPRVQAYAGYKGHRPPDPEGLPEQFGILRRLLDAFGLPQADAPGWEAEDAIGSLTAQAGARDRNDVVTGDRDLIQLVRDPQVRVLFTLRGVTQVRVLDEAGVLEKYRVAASRYADFATLRGDPSDGLPGVKGVGEKTARLLVEAYPSIDAMVEEAAWSKSGTGPLQHSASLRAAVRDAVDYLAAMRDVVPIRRDVEVRRWQGARDEANVDRLAERYRLTGPVRRLREALVEGRLTKRR